MAIEQPAGAYEPDTNTHATIAVIGTYGDKKDTLYVPGEGVYLSPHGINSLESAAKAQARTHADKPPHLYRGFIDEETIEYWHNVIQTNKKMQQLADKKESQRKAYESGCYPGTDTQDQTKHNEKANTFSIDRSKSTIVLSVCSGRSYLNGSAVEHAHFVHIEITSPDGRDLCAVAMTFDQFASFLVSNMSTPCTLESYWSVNDQCLRLSEVVKKPENINARMAQRLNDRLDDLNNDITAMRQEMQEAVNAGRAMSKTKLADFEKRLGWFITKFNSNRDFTVQQAQEEVSSIVEQAACAIAWEHRLSQAELLDSSPVQALVSAWKPPLPALDDDTTTH